MKCGLFFFLYMLLASLSHVMAVGVVVSFDPPVMRCKPLAHSPPICRLKIESKEEVFPYSGSTNLANAILRRIDAGQTVSLSIIGYSSYDQCIGLLAHLNLREVFAYPKGMKVQPHRVGSHHAHGLPPCTARHLVLGGMDAGMEGPRGHLPLRPRRHAHL